MRCHFEGKKLILIAESNGEHKQLQTWGDSIDDLWDGEWPLTVHPNKLIEIRKEVYSRRLHMTGEEI